MSLENIPSLIADAWNITEASAQVLLSLVVLLAVLLPVMVLSKGKNTFAIIVVIFLVELLLIGITWLPFWVLIATVAIMAISIAMLGTDAVIGGE